MCGFKRFPTWVLTIAAFQVFFYLVYPGVYPEIAVFSRDAAHAGELWTFITYAFLHASIMHLVGNISVLVLVGLPMEQWDGVRVVGVWALSVAVGALFHALETPVGLVGGSAGVYGLLAAHLANLTLNWNSIPNRVIYLMLIVALAVPPIADYLTAPSWSMTSYSAHFGGAIGGLFGGFALLRDFHAEPMDGYIRGAGVLIGAAVITVAAIVLYT